MDFSSKKRSRPMRASTSPFESSSLSQTDDPVEGKTTFASQAHWKTEWLSSIRNLPSNLRMLSSFDPQVLVDRTESLLLLGLILREVRTPVGVAAALAQALRSIMHKSITSDVIQKLQPYLISTFGYDVFDAQASEEDVSQASWLMSLRGLSDNWTACQQFAGFEKISKLISMTAALGLCDISNFNVDFAGLRVFSVGAHKKHVKATDFVTAVLDTVVYFVEGAYKCFEEGNLDAFFYSSAAAKQFDQKYFDVQEIFVHAKSMSLSKHKLTYNGVSRVLSDNDFSVILDEVIDLATTVHSGAASSWEKNVVSTRLANLRKMRADWQSLRVNGDLREAPFGIYVRGKSSVGKSSVAAFLMRCALTAADADCSDDRIIALKESEKFDSNIKSHINGYFIDDVGNTKPDFVEKSPCEKLIDIMNNMPTHANMAEAELKGRVSIEPKVVVATSNVDLAILARKYSMMPYSIVRRMHVHLDITVKPEFQTSTDEPTLDSRKVFAKFGKESDEIHDLWNISVSVPHEAHSGLMLNEEHKDKSINWVIRYLNGKVRDHFAYQRRLVNQMKNLGEKLRFCSECKLPGTLCECANTDSDSVDTDSVVCKVEEVCVPTRCMDLFEDASDLYTNQANWDDLSDDDSVWDDSISESPEERALTRVYEDAFINEPLGRLVEEEVPLAKTVVDKVKDDVYTPCVEYLKSIDNRNWNWLNYVPDCVFHSRFFQYGNMIRRHADFRMYERTCRQALAFWFIFVSVISVSGYGLLYTALFLSTLFPAVLLYFSLIYYWKVRCERQLAAARDFSPTIFAGLRTLDAQRLCGISVAIAALYYLVRAYRTSSVVVSQGLVASTTAEIDERDAEVNPWANAVVNELHVSEKSRAITFDRLKKKASKNLCHVMVANEGKTVTCDAWFIASNCAILPSHIMAGKTEVKASFSRYGVGSNGSSFRSPLSIVTTKFIPDTDLCVTYVPNSGTWADLTDYLPIEQLPSSAGCLVHRTSEGELRTSKLYATSQKVSTTAGTFPGHSYKLEFPTFNGLCTSLVIFDTRYPVIGGFHLGGHEGRVQGVSGTLLQKQALEALSRLSRVDGVLLPLSNGTMPTRKYDVQFYQNDEVHQKSPVRYLPENNNLQYFGQVSGRASYTKSSVVPTVISDIVEEVTGVPRKFGPPKFHRWKNWQASLEHSSTPSAGVENSLVERAVKDYKEPLLKLIDNPNLPWKRDIRPLTEMETVCGRDGKRFVDKMPPSTSVGYPLGGPKKDYLVYLDPEEHDAFACPAELDPMFWEEARSMEEKYLQGERAYPIFKACLKDEPTKLTKDKVRVFQASEVAFQLLVRKYFLPIARFLSMNPLVSECAVGVNAHGPEWAELMDYVDRFGEDRILAGDYATYDLRMPAQSTLTGFRIYIDIAEHTGNYSERDLKVMRGIATDNVYPLSAYNGDLVMLAGTVPSGTNLTVYLNNAANSVFHRCGFFDLCAKAGITAPPYREAVASTFYGDDAKSSVKRGFDCFNHIAFAEWLRQRDIVFTMPDKESDPVPFMHTKDVDFLKRKSIYNPELKLCLGALDEGSIFKSLHAVLKSSVIGEKEQAAQNIDGGLREWFAHGREVYELRREQMREVAEKAEISHITRELDITFDDRVDKYKEKYFKPTSEPSDV